MGFGYSKFSYSGTMLYPFKCIFQEDVVSTIGWFMISFILILYLKYKLHIVEIKTAITGY